MHPDAGLLGFVAAGLAGSGHCFSMCGGIAALGGMPGSRVITLMFNTGRVLGYMVIGALGAVLVGAGAGVAPSTAAGPVLRILLGAVLVIAGLGTLLRRAWFDRLNRYGGRVWARLQGVAVRLLPISNWRRAVGLGVLWGWIPCGLVYTMAPAAWLTASPVHGALAMMMFGLGTLPSMALIGLGGGSLRRHLRSDRVRGLAAVAMIVAGLWVMGRPIFHMIAGGGGGHAH